MLLQEVEPSFFEASVNPKGARLLAKYTLFPSYGIVKGKDGGEVDGPGTAVLIAHASGLEVGPVASLGGGDECGGVSKTTTVVEANDKFGRTVAFASTHFTCTSLSLPPLYIFLFRPCSWSCIVDCNLFSSRTRRGWGQ